MFEQKYRIQNTRRYKRLKSDYLVKYQEPGATEVFVSNLKDISAGGLKFWTDQIFAEKTLLRLSVWIPPLDRKLETLGRILRVRKTKDAPIYYVSVQFIEISVDDQKILNEFIEHLATVPEAHFLIHDAPVVKRKKAAQAA